MSAREIGKLRFDTVYPLYVQKALRKGRTQEEVDAILCWLTGYGLEELRVLASEPVDFQTFFDRAPAFHPASGLVKGVVCGVRVEEIEDPITRKVRILDKLIDELAKGKAMEKILRS